MVNNNLQGLSILFHSSAASSPPSQFPTHPIKPTTATSQKMLWPVNTARRGKTNPASATTKRRRRCFRSRPVTSSSGAERRKRCEKLVKSQERNPAMAPASRRPVERRSQIDKRQERHDPQDQYGCPAAEKFSHRYPHGDILSSSPSTASTSRSICSRE